MVLTRSRASGGQAASSGSDLSESKPASKTRATRTAAKNLEASTKGRKDSAHSPSHKDQASVPAHAIEAIPEDAELFSEVEQERSAEHSVDSGSEADKSSSGNSTDEEVSEDDVAAVKPTAAEQPLCRSANLRRPSRTDLAEGLRSRVLVSHPVASVVSADTGPVSMDTDSGDDDDVLGGPMSELAASIRSALLARTETTTGGPSPSSSRSPANQTSPHHRRNPSATRSVAPPPAAAAAATAVQHDTDEDSGDEAAEDLSHPVAELAGLQLSWQPGVSIPEQKFKRAAHATALVAEKEKGLAKKLKDVALARPPGAAPPADQWWQLPAQSLTADMKRELRLLHLRATYNTKRFYKNFDSTKLPERFQIGTICDAPTDFYGGRLTQRQRKATITEEVMADPDITAMRKRRYAKLQEESIKYRRVKKRKTDLPRDTKRKARPKH